LKNYFLKYIAIVFGILFVGLGILGIILPVLPTTPFLLLASFLFVKSSKKLDNWLINNKILGEYIYNYRKFRAIKRKAKIIAICLLWFSISFSAYMIDIIYVRILLLIVAIGVSTHLLLIKTLENIEK